jgi:hypothetical protein
MDTSITNSTTVSINTTEIESDLGQASISELLAEDPSLLGGDDVAELLQRLSSADSMAQGMESKVDSVLQDLDELLALLGAEGTPSTSEDTDSTSALEATKPSSGLNCSSLILDLLASLTSSPAELARSTRTWTSVMEIH